jgi:hypothetical protein
LTQSPAGYGGQTGNRQKHLERIYRKLGVTGRTAVLAAMRRTWTT